MYSTKIIGRSDTAIRFKILKDGVLISFQEVFKGWENSSEFIDFYVQSIKGFGFNAFFWEHPGLTKDTIDRAYECILQKSERIDSRPLNEQAFADYLHTPNVVEDFYNLGRNARLVIPTMQLDAEIYKHFGSFLFHAEALQIQAFFNRIGTVIPQEIEKEAMIWLNTAGMGVLWLHVRMDTRPKYYKTKNYKGVVFFN